MSQWHTNKPWSSFPKDRSFTVYCAYNNHFNSVRTRIKFSLYVYAYTFFRTHVILPCHVFVPFLSVRVTLSPDRGLPISPNIVLYVQPQISAEHPLLFIVGLIWSPQYCFITLIQGCTLNLSTSHSSFGTH